MGRIQMIMLPNMELFLKNDNFDIIYTILL